MLGGVLVGYGDVARFVVDAKTAVVEVIVAVGERQGVLLVDLPLQTCFRTQLADVLTVGSGGRFAIGYWILVIG